MEVCGWFMHSDIQAYTGKILIKEEKRMTTNRIPESNQPEQRLKELPVVETYHPREHAILAEYLGRKKKVPKEAKKFDPYEIIPFEEGHDDAEHGVVCRPSPETSDMDKALANAVARIALAPVRLSLPRWGASADGEVYHTRQKDLDSKLPQRGFRSPPVLALSLNWANSGPGFSWPLDYYVAWLPFYDEYVVTVSYDDPIVAGYLDLAIGTLPEKAEVEVHLKQVIQTHWEETAEYLHGWQECWNNGIVEDPWAWRNEISWAIPDS